MKPFYLSLILMLALFACALPDAKSQHASHKKDTADEEFVFKLMPFIDGSIMQPPYGLDRVKALIAKMESKSTDNFVATRLDAKVYDSLSFNEKFTYHMIHPESYSQNC